VKGEMARKQVWKVILTILLVSVFPLTLGIQPVKAIGTIYIRADGSVEPPTESIQRNGDIYTLTGNITLYEVDGIVIERDNVILDGAGYTLQVTITLPYPPICTGIDLKYRRNVTVKNIIVTGFDYAVGLYCSNSNVLLNNIFTNCDYGCYTFGGSGEESSNNTIVNNTFQDIFYTGISLTAACNNNNISSNRVLYADTGILVFGRNNIIYENFVFNGFPIGFDMYGIDVRGLDNLVANNNITGGSHGITIYGFNNVVTHNNVSQPNSAGVQISGSHNILIDNFVSVISRDGGEKVVYLDDAQNTIFHNNTLYCNALHAYGIFAKNSHYNKISVNTIVSAHRFQGSTGLCLDMSDNNLVCHNNFIQNSLQVHVDMSLNNVWDDDYPSGGNYWDDYEGMDLFSGLGQNVTGSDGIGDALYIIDLYNKDRYPLMKPWTPTETSVTVNGRDYPVTIVSNTTIDRIDATANSLYFKSSGPTGDKGYILVIFPMVNTTEIKVFVNGVKLTPPLFPVINTNGTYYFIYFEFTLSIHDITIQFAQLTYTLSIHSSPFGVTFTVDGTPQITPWSETYIEGTSLNLLMPETHTVGDAKYYWSRWSDGVTSRSRTFIMDKDITLTAYFTGPYYELTVTSMPITGITFTINGVPKTTPYVEWLPQGSYTLEMPETYIGYNWSHWLEDGDTNRVKTIYLHGTTWTGVYVLAAPPPPVGGLWVPINKFQLLAPWIGLASVITLAAVSIVYVKHRKKQQS
jgi:parallel beta-helix repeat protein